MRITFPAPFGKGEVRCALTSSAAAKLRARGHVLLAEAPHYSRDLGAAGVEIFDDTGKVLADAEVVVVLDPPSTGQLSAIPSGAVMVGLLSPYGAADRIEAYDEAGIIALSLESIPRISRAQSMDVLSSQASLAGYRAVIEAASRYRRVFPMMMTAAGTLAPARVFVMGAGVAGLQAIATARRLGAMVSATDVRPAAKEQVESLAASFVAVEDEEFRAAESEKGYAKPMSDAYRAKQAALVVEHIAKQDIVITTALIPGRPAPRLIDQTMVASMRPGSVIVDLAAAAGGNCALTRAGETIVHGGVVIYGASDVLGAVREDASALLAGNIVAFMDLLSDKDGRLAPDWSDDILCGAALTGPALSSGGATETK